MQQAQRRSLMPTIGMRLNPWVVLGIARLRKQPIEMLDCAPAGDSPILVHSIREPQLLPLRGQHRQPYFVIPSHVRDGSVFDKPHVRHNQWVIPSLFDPDRCIRIA